MRHNFFHSFRLRRTGLALLALLALVAFCLFTAAITLGAIVWRGYKLDIRNWREPSNLHMDASRLDPLPVNEIVALSPDSILCQNQLNSALAKARLHNIGIAISGARHSMGGQTAVKRGIVIDMLSHNRLRLDTLWLKQDRDTLPKKEIVLHAQAGARWSSIIPFLDQYGLAVFIMQSNNPFTIGGTLSVNAHGWQHNAPPFGNSVISFRVFTSQGEIKQCSRTENAELFHAVIGGYGLLGLVLDITLKVIPNVEYQAESETFPASKYARVFKQKVDGDSTIGLVYGRLSIAPESFLKEARLTRYRQNQSSKKPPPLTENPPSPTLENPTLLFRLQRWFFLASVGSDIGKSVRWFLEKATGGESSSLATRNRIMNDPIDLFENWDSSRTQLLHEYFLPRDSLEKFLIAARQIIPRHKGDLLNLTLRNLEPDSDSYLNYAREPVFSLVMLFSQLRTVEANLAMQSMTQALIDAALTKGGTFYLPYRRHATTQQLRQAYPMLPEFIALKKKYDPEEIFQNEFYRQYIGHTQK